MDKLRRKLYNHVSNTLNNSDNNTLLKKIVSSLNKKGIIIVSGVIGSNKLGLIKEMLLKTKMNNNFFYFNAYLDVNNSISSYKDLENIYNDKKIIILENIDSIDQAEKFVHTEFKQGKKVILIGNNLHIKGVKEIELLPKALDNKTPEYIELLAHKIITTDIYIKQKLKNFPLLQHTLRVLSENSSLSSVREMHKILNHNGSKISQITLIEYINYILESKLIKKVLRYDIKTDKFSTGKARYFFTQTSIRQVISQNTLSQNLINENKVFQKLESLGHTIFTGKNGTFDFSFITDNNTSIPKGTSPLQEEDKKDIIVHVSSHSEKNEIKKEAKKLLKIPGNYNKYLIVHSIKELGIRPSSYLPVKIVEVEEFLNTKK